MAIPGSWIGKAPAPKPVTPVKEDTQDEIIERLEKNLGLDAKPTTPPARHEEGRKSRPSQTKTSTAGRSGVSDGTDRSRQKRKPKTSGTNASPSSRKSTKSTPSSKKRIEKPEHELFTVQFSFATKIFCNCGEEFLDAEQGQAHIRKVIPKKPFVLKEHLTDRPFAQNEALQSLREQLPQAVKHNPRNQRNKEKN